MKTIMALLTLFVLLVMLAPLNAQAGTINGTKKITSGTAGAFDLWLFVEGEPGVVYKFEIGNATWSTPGQALPMLTALTDKKPADIKCATFSTYKEASGVFVKKCDESAKLMISMPALN